MNAKKFTVIGLMAIVVLFLYLGMNAYKIRVQTAQDVKWTPDLRQRFKLDTV